MKTIVERLKNNIFWRHKRIIPRILWFIAVGVILAVFLVEGYCLIVRPEGSAILPPKFGNFPENRASMDNRPAKDAFEFAVVGDTRSLGTFNNIVIELRKTPIDFAVLLGDCTFDGTEGSHQFFRAECAREYSLPFPVFYVVGNHDVSAEAFPVSRFERDYGPSIFSFEYQRCLFIFLRMFPGELSIDESLAFLAQFKDVPKDKYRHKFVFVHDPPAFPDYLPSRGFRQDEKIIKDLERVGVDYVFGGHYHGYARITLRNINFIITGGGGARFKEESGRQINHALLVRVDPDSVYERILPVPHSRNLEDKMEAIAFTRVLPWMTGHVRMCWTFNMLGFLALLALLWIRFRKLGGNWGQTL
jgi:hypothetical protein